MDDNYFDEKLKGILESAPEIQPDATAVSDMQQRLRGSQKPNRRRSFLPFLAVLLFLPLFLGFGIFYKKYDALDKKVTELTQIITQNHHIDTVVEKQFIYQVDTIYAHYYHTKYITEQKEEKYARPYYSYQHFSPNDNALKSANLKYNYNWSLGSEKFSLFAKKPGSSIFSEYFVSDNSGDVFTESAIAFDPFDPINIRFLKVQNEEIFRLNKEPADPELINRKKKVNPAHYFIPNGFSLGINGNPASLSINDFGGGVRSIGINAAIELPGNRSLNIGAEWLNHRFEVKDDPDLFARFPIGTPTDPTDILHELKGTFTYLQVPVSMRQGLLKGEKFHPFVKAGFVAYKPLKQDFVYEYIDGSGEYKVNSSFKDGVFSIDNFRLGLGTDYVLSKHISAHAEVQYQHGFSLNTSEYFSLRYWTLNMGLKYRFKS